MFGLFYIGILGKQSNVVVHGFMTFCLKFKW